MNDCCSLAVRSDAAAAEAGAAGGPALFTGPRDLRATLRKHMITLSEEGDPVEVLGTKRPRSCQVRLGRPFESCYKPLCFTPAPQRVLVLRM